MAFKGSASKSDSTDYSKPLLVTPGPDSLLAIGVSLLRRS